MDSKLILTKESGQCDCLTQCSQNRIGLDRPVRLIGLRTGSLSDLEDHVNRLARELKKSDKNPLDRFIFFIFF